MATWPPSKGSSGIRLNRPRKMLTRRPGRSRATRPSASAAWAPRRTTPTIEMQPVLVARRWRRRARRRCSAVDDARLAARRPVGRASTTASAKLLSPLGEKKLADRRRPSPVMSVPTSSTEPRAAGRRRARSRGSFGGDADDSPVAAVAGADRADRQRGVDGLVAAARSRRLTDSPGWRPDVRRGRRCSRRTRHRPARDDPIAGLEPGDRSTACRRRRAAAGTTR